MFKDTVTIFNFYQDPETEICRWYPKVLTGVELQISNGILRDKEGKEAADKAILHIPFKNGRIQSYKYMKSLEWRRSEEKNQCLTLSETDFFMEGSFDMVVSVNDDDYPQGFFEHMKKTYDDVYGITSISRYDTIPYIAVGGN